MISKEFQIGNYLVGEGLKGVLDGVSVLIKFSAFFQPSFKLQPISQLLAIVIEFWKLAISE